MNNRSSLWCIVILLGLWVYTIAGEILHFFNHFFPGIAMGVIILIILASLRRPTQHLECTIPFLTYIYAIVPEFVVMSRSFFSNIKQEHAPWENVFLLHNTLDHLLEQSELIIPITASILAITLYAYQWIKKV